MSALWPADPTCTDRIAASISFRHEHYREYHSISIALPVEKNHSERQQYWQKMVFSTGRQKQKQQKLTNNANGTENLPTKKKTKLRINWFVFYFPRS